MLTSIVGVIFGIAVFVIGLVLWCEMEDTESILEAVGFFLLGVMAVLIGVVVVTSILIF
ncbi:hypothetical protein NNG48_07020 [Enterococcus faecium]|nr:hypothetical protein [Enterococcus faecium]